MPPSDPTQAGRREAARWKISKLVADPCPSRAYTEVVPNRKTEARSSPSGKKSHFQLKRVHVVLSQALPRMCVGAIARSELVRIVATFSIAEIIELSDALPLFQRPLSQQLSQR